MFGETALKAAALCRANPQKLPAEAWIEAIQTISTSLNTRKKGCPKATFTGLCDAGYVIDIPARPGGTIGVNAGYAVAALKELQAEPTLVEQPSELWKRVGHGGKGDGQVDVLLALWKAGVISSKT